MRNVTVDTVGARHLSVAPLFLPAALSTDIAARMPWPRGWCDARPALFFHLAYVGSSRAGSSAYQVMQRRRAGTLLAQSDQRLTGRRYRRRDRLGKFLSLGVMRFANVLAGVCGHPDRCSDKRWLSHKHSNGWPHVVKSATEHRHRRLELHDC